MGGRTVPPGTSSGECRKDHRARRDVAPVLDRLGTRDVDDGNRRREHDVGRDHRALSHDDTFDEDGPRADEGTVLDDHRPRLRRLEDASDADASRQVDVGADLRARS